MLKITTLYGGIVLMAVLASGCQTAPALRMPATTAAAIKTVAIIPVESPPLEIIPDTLYERMPNVAHDRNMALPYAAVDAVYLMPGGIRAVGKVGQGDSVEPEGTSAAAAETRPGSWSPTWELAVAASRRLQAARLGTVLSRETLDLPLVNPNARASLWQWHAAAADWYQRDGEFSLRAEKPADAVLEIGIDRYRIFEGQVSLRVLAKLVDPATGQILARTARHRVLQTDTAVPALLYPNGEPFKGLIREQGARLVAEAMRDMGLPD